MRRLAAAIFAAAGLTSIPAPAHAACSWLSCTQVYNQRTSQASILVAAQWQNGTTNTSTKQTVAPGATSTLRDVNAFWIPTGCHGTSKSGTFYGGRWYKPALDRYAITVRCP